MLNDHEREEAEYRDSPRMWDAGEGVCCPYFQTGACAHTEAIEAEDQDLPVVRGRLVLNGFDLGSVEAASYRYANVPTDGVYTGPDPSARDEWVRKVR